MSNPSFAVEIISDESMPAWLPADMQEDCQEVLARDDYRSCLALKIGDKVSTFWDYGDPEDNSFGRRWAWVSKAIQDAYDAGRRDAIAEEANEDARQAALR